MMTEAAVSYWQIKIVKLARKSKAHIVFREQAEAYGRFTKVVLLLYLRFQYAAHILLGQPSRIDENGSDRTAISNDLSSASKERFAGIGILTALDSRQTGAYGIHDVAPFEY